MFDWYVPEYMDRRRYLQALAGAFAASLSGCSSFGDGDPTPAIEEPRTIPSQEWTPSPSLGTPTPSARFGTVLDAVSDIGCDPSGAEPCDQALTEAISDDTLIEFPPGEYLVTTPLRVEENISFGIRGTGGTRRGVTFRHPEGYSDVLLNVRDGEGCLFENFTAVQTEDRQTNSGLVLLQRDGLTVRNVEVEGFTPTDGGTKDMIVQITEPSGVGVVERFVSVGGGEVGVYPNAYAGFYSGRQHRGTLQLVNCHLEECGSNGVYASRTYGPVQILGGLFKNNAVSQIRVCGKDSFVRNAKIVIDTENANRVAGTYNAVRGLWWESGWQGKTGGRIENCEFVVDSAERRRGLLEIDGTAGRMTLSGCTFRVDQDAFWAIVAAPPGVSPMGGPPDQPWDLTIQNTRVIGNASDGVDVQIDGRPSSTIDGLTIEHENGQNRDGLFLSNCHGSEITGCSSQVTRYPLWIYTDTTRESAPYLLYLGRGISLTTNQVLDGARPVFDTDGSGSGVRVQLPSVEEYSLVSTRTEDQTYFGLELDATPEYLPYTRG